MDERRLQEELVRSGALKKGHFRLSSGLHSDTYVQCALLLSDPETAVEVGRDLAAGFGGEVDAVACPALGGVVIGFTVALALGVPMVFSERAGDKMTLRRGFAVEPGSRLLLVEDVVTTGGSVLELAGLVEELGGTVTGLACIIDRGGMEERRYPLYALTRVQAATYGPGDCEMCARGVPMDTPGSRYSG